MSRRVLVCAAICGLAFSAPLFAGTWCDVVFSDVAHDAGIVVLARVEKARGAAPVLHVAEVLKDRSESGFGRLPSRILDGIETKNGDHVLVALDEEQRLVVNAGGLGMCEAISVLVIRGGKLRSRDRVNYDSLTGTLTLEEIREQLRDDPTDAPRQASISGR
jgi:hypothetical protein